jgi:hypothetical protein
MSKIENIEGIEKRLRWSLNSQHLAIGAKIYVHCVFNSENEPQAEIKWYSTDFSFNGGYKVMYNSAIIHAEQVFTGEETDKLRLRVRAIDRNLYYDEIESILKTSLKELKHTHRGSLKGKKFGL